MPLVPLARSDQADQAARLLSAASSSMRRLPQDARTRPSQSLTVTTLSASPTSRAAPAASPPSSANTTSCSIECAVPSTAAGARSRSGLTSYSSRHRYQDTRISGRTPCTSSSPAANRSRAAAIRPRLSSESAAPFVAGSGPVVGSLAPFIQFPLGSGERASQDRAAVADPEASHRRTTFQRRPARRGGVGARPPGEEAPSAPRAEAHRPDDPRGGEVRGFHHAGPQRAAAPVRARQAERRDARPVAD